MDFFGVNCSSIIMESVDRRYINKNKVAILLSTYNGIPYISAFIQSIKEQVYQDFTLYIRDDGSKDGTLDFLKTIEENYSKIIVLDSDENLGSKYSFLYMLQNIDSEYYMFADQDDIWLPNKILMTIEFLENQQKNKGEVPIVVHTDLRLVDGNLNLIAKSYWNYLRIPTDMPHAYDLLCHFNDITGCTMAFNKEAKKCISPYWEMQLPKFVYHDYFISLLVSLNNGLLLPLHEQTILFRRHGNNETNPLSKRSSILKRPFMIISYVKEQYRRHLFFNQLKNNYFLFFLINKFRTQIIKSLWRKKIV